ncbi:ribosomal protection-like ABC-F family protein [Glutamicibacter sp.]|uniref:ribosomal protection-like ABC-F family protein n=1 Tax=Glutamicibacter sp. TaxID=1931995 RepID=UPI0028BE0C78|nr:ABC-F family ATP-binding cassette domain-containing protein [Glutamicibacter sp.]
MTSQYQTSSIVAPAEFHLELIDVSVSFGDRDVLQETNLLLNATDRIAIVGDNGSGKSTLLRVLAGSLIPDRGQRRVEVPGHIAYAAQAPEFAPGHTIQQVIDAYHHKFRQLELLMTAINVRLQSAAGSQQEVLMGQLQQVTDMYEAAEGYTLNQRLQRALQQLGLGKLDRERPVARLSGGQRSRLALACVLCSGAQVLLLDEPTNDLDDAAMAWLERSLEMHRGTLVVVSHDRMFLKRFARTILEIADCHLTRYGDGYEGYLHAKEQERLSIRVAYETWVAELERSRQLVAKNASRVAAVPRKQEKAGFGHGSFRLRSRNHGSTSKIRQAKSRIEELESQPVQRPAEELEFALPAVGQQGEEHGLLLSIEAATRKAEPQLSCGSFDIRSGQRWLVTGSNGAGKTSLLRMLSGELDYSGGKIRRAEDLRCAWLRQEAMPLPGESLLQAFALATDQYLDDAADALAALGLFSPRDFLRHPLALSAGQRRRLELAVAVSSRAQLLLLDEPTNHLAPALVEQLEDALADYPGAVISVSHDRRWQQKLRQGPLHRLEVQTGKVNLLD